MSTLPSPGARFRQAVAEQPPLQVLGAINAYFAKLAEQSGARALYLSGGGVAACSCGIPDLGITTMEDVLTDLRRITDATELPVLVDIDTGWGGAFNIARAVRAMIRGGAAAVHIEDQVQAKRCGHRPGKAIVSKEEMVDRIKAAADALAVEGLQSAIDRACACVEAGADMVFPEAMTDLAMYKEFARAVGVPVLANITEFGSTPLYTVEELAGADVSLVLYPLSAFRAAAKAALTVYQGILRDGSQKNVLDTMQTRAELYDYLGYHAFEEKLNQLFAKENKQ